MAALKGLVGQVLAECGASGGVVQVGAVWVDGVAGVRRGPQLRCTSLWIHGAWTVADLTSGTPGILMHVLMLPSLQDDYVLEMCRFGAGELHVVAAFMGGMASQVGFASNCRCCIWWWSLMCLVAEGDRFGRCCLSWYHIVAFYVSPVSTPA